MIGQGFKPPKTPAGAFLPGLVVEIRGLPVPVPLACITGVEPYWILHLQNSFLTLSKQSARKPMQASVLHVV